MRENLHLSSSAQSITYEPSRGGSGQEYGTICNEFFHIQIAVVFADVEQCNEEPEVAQEMGGAVVHGVDVKYFIKLEQRKISQTQGINFLESEL